jgi:hypothetical protein
MVVNLVFNSRQQAPAPLRPGADPPACGTEARRGGTSARHQQHDGTDARPGGASHGRAARTDDERAHVWGNSGQCMGQARLFLHLCLVSDLFVDGICCDVQTNVVNCEMNL